MNTALLACFLSLAPLGQGYAHAAPQGAGPQTLLQITAELKREHLLRNSEEQRLSEPAKALLRKLRHTVHLEVFLSPRDSFPDSLQGRRAAVLKLVGQIEEFGAGKVKANVHEIRPGDPLVPVAERFGITNKASDTYFVHHGGTLVRWDRDLYLGIGMTVRERGVASIPFLDDLSALESDLLGPLGDLAGLTTKKTIGVLATDARIMGAATPPALKGRLGSLPSTWRMIESLRKRYEVLPVRSERLGETDLDALLVAQPSTLDDAGLEQLLAAIRAGTPTALFEDPLPMTAQVTGTYEPRKNLAQPAFTPPGSPPSASPEKGDLSKLWKLLGIHFNRDPAAKKAGALEKRVLRDPFNPNPAITRSDAFPDELVYAAGTPFLENLSSGFAGEHCLFMCAGSLYRNPASPLAFEPLMQTRGGPLSGYTNSDTFQAPGIGGVRLDSNRPRHPGSGSPEVVSASITGSIDTGGERKKIRVIVTADLDAFADPIFRLKESPDPAFPLEVRNVEFLAGLMDHLAGREPSALPTNRKPIRFHVRTALDIDLAVLDKRIASERTKTNEARKALEKRMEEETRQSMLTPGSVSMEQFLQMQNTQRTKYEPLAKEIEEAGQAAVRIHRNHKDALLAAPYTGRVRVFDAENRPVETGSYAGGFRHGDWIRFNPEGEEISRKTYQSPTPDAPATGLARLEKADAERRNKQKTQAERLRRLLSESGEKQATPPDDGAPETKEKPAPRPDERPPEIRASHILVSYEGATHAAPSIKRSKEEARAEAERIRKLIVTEKKDFAETARAFSEGPSKSNGGDLGRFKFGMMIQSFSETAFALKPGDVSQVVETQFGFHVILRTE